MIYKWRDGTGQNKSTGSTRIYWTEEEINSVADEFILLRIADPIESATVLAERAQRKVLPGARQREIVSINNIKALVESIKVRLKAFVDKPAPIPPPPPAPEVHVQVLEVPRKLSAAEMLKELDEPTLEALLSAKRISRENNLQQILCAAATRLGAENLPKIKPYVPRLEAFDAGLKKQPRIAVIGMATDLHDPLVTEIREAQLDTILSFPDGKDTQTISRCDYAIIIRPPGDDRSNSDRAIGQLGRDRVALLETGEILVVKRFIRDFCTRQ